MELHTQTFFGPEELDPKEPRLIYQLETGGNDQDVQESQPNAQNESDDKSKTPEQKEAIKRKEQVEAMPKEELSPESIVDEAEKAVKLAEKEAAKETGAMAKIESDMKQTVDKSIQNDESKEAIQNQIRKQNESPEVSPADQAATDAGETAAESVGSGDPKSAGEGPAPDVVENLSNKRPASIPNLRTLGLKGVLAQMGAPPATPAAPPAGAPTAAPSPSPSAPNAPTASPNTPASSPATTPNAPNAAPRRTPQNTQLDAIAGEIFTSKPQSLQDGVNQFRNNLLAGADFAKTPEEKNILNQAVDAAVQQAEQVNFDPNNPEAFMRECAKIRQNFLKNNPQLRALSNKMQERAVIKENINNAGKILGEIAKMLREFMQAFRSAAGLAPPSQSGSPPGGPPNAPANAPNAPSGSSALSAPEQTALDEIRNDKLSNVIADATTERDAAKNKLDGPPPPGLRKKVATQGVREVDLKKDVEAAEQALDADPNNTTKKNTLRNAEEALRLHQVDMENTEKERQVQEQKLNDAQKKLDTIKELEKKAQEQADSIEKEMKEMTATLAGTKSPEMSVIHDAVENVTTSLDAKLNIKFDLANYNPQEWKDMAATAKQFGVDASAFDIEDAAGKKIIKNPDAFLKGLQALHQHAKQGVEKKTEIVTSLEQNGIARGQAEKAAKISEEYGIEFEASSGTLKVKSGDGDKIAGAYIDDIKNLPNTHQVKLATKLHLDNLLSDVRTEGGFNALKTLLAKSPGGEWQNEDVVRQLVDLAKEDGMEGFEKMYVDGNGIAGLPDKTIYGPKIQILINSDPTKYVNLHRAIKSRYGVT